MRFSRYLILCQVPDHLVDIKPQLMQQFLACSYFLLEQKPVGGFAIHFGTVYSSKLIYYSKFIVIIGFYLKKSVVTRLFHTSKIHFSYPRKSTAMWSVFCCYIKCNCCFCRSRVFKSRSNIHWGETGKKKMMWGGQDINLNNK